MKKLALIFAIAVLLGGMTINGTFAKDFSLDAVFKALTGFADSFINPQKGDEIDGRLVNVGLVYQMREGDTLVERNNNLFAHADHSDGFFTAANNKTAATFGSSTYALWDESQLKGAVDKFISVQNNGTEAVYYCIAIAVSQPERVMHLNLNENAADFQWIKNRSITIDGTKYKMHLAIGENALAVNGLSPAALLQVALDKGADAADLANGVDIRVKVMAVETAGFGSLTAYEALNAALGFEETETTFNPFVAPTTT